VTRPAPDAVQDADRERRRAIREYVRRHHPDVGGDPAAFAAGLAALRSGPAGPRDPGPPAAPRVTVVRSRGPRSWLRRLTGARPVRRTRTLR
jgi:hypothetical protein